MIIPELKTLCRSGRNVHAVFAHALCCLFLLVGHSVVSQTADFSFTPAQGCAPLVVQFTNLSTNAVTFHWNFGNGNTSTLQNPSNVFISAGTYNITLTVTSTVGQTAVKTKQLIVSPAPSADFSVNASSACEGYGVFAFQNNSANYDSSVWDFGDGTTSNLQNPTHVYAFSGSFTVKLIVFNKAMGCSDIKVRTSYIIVHPQPSATISVDTNRTCDYGHMFSFSSQVSSPAISYTWSFGDGTSSTLASPTHIYNLQGGFDPVLITGNSFGCYDTARLTDSLYILLNPIPQVSVSGDTGCTPFNVTYQVWANDVYSYLWDFGNNLTGSARVGYVTYTNAGVYQPLLTVVYNNGCVFQDSLPVVVVDQSPSPSFTMTNHNGCVPLSVTFNNNTPTGNYSWYWDFGDGDSSLAMNPVHIYDSVGYFVPALVTKSPNGCTNIARNGWYYVSAMGPTASFTADVTNGCYPLEVNFTNASIGSVSWFWDFGNGTTSTLQHPSCIYSSAGNYQVMLVATNAQGCKDTFYLSNQINVTGFISNYQPPAPVHACVPHTVYLADASAAIAWLWDFGDGTTSTDENPVHVYSTPGTFTVSLTTWAPNGGCEHHIPNFQTFIIDASSPGFTYTVSPCPPYEVFFTDTSLNASSWQWSFGDGGSSTAQNPSHVYPGPGIYNVVLNVGSPNGCITTFQAMGGVVITGLGAQASVVTADSAAPFNVQFFANSTNATSWSWSFGDGGTSNLENPTHTFLTSGPFTITLTIANDSCSYTYVYPPLTFGGSSSSSGSIGVNPVTTNPIIYRCAPYTVQFSNYYDLADSVLWNFGDGNTSTESNPSHTYTDSGMYVPILYGYLGGVIVDSIQFSDTIYVVEPFTNFNIATTSLCNGVIVDVSTQGTASVYEWDFGNGNTSSSPSASQIYPLQNASYSISLSVEDTNGCSSYIAKSFTTSVSHSISSSRRRACAGDTISFNSGNLNFASYAWDFGDGSLLDTRKNPAHVFQDSGMFAVSLVATDINGCVVNYNLSYLIEVFDPQASFVLKPTTSNCTWVLAEFVNTSVNSDSWLWDFGNNAVSTLKNPTQYYTQLGYYDVTLTAFKNICKSTYTLTQAVYVPNRSANFNYIQSEACLPFDVQFTDLSVDAVKWSWDFGDGDTSNLQNPVHTFTRVPTGPITLTITDVNGCSVNKVSPNVNYSDAKFEVSSKAGCNPMSVGFTDSSLNVTSWQWDFGDGNTSTQQFPSHTYTVDGFYPVTLIVESTYGCFDTLTVDSAISVLTSRAGIQLDTIVGCVPLVVSFNDNSINAVQWDWAFGDGTISTNENPSHIYSQPGEYTVQLIATNANNCADTLTYNHKITVYGATPYFTVSNSNGCGPLPVVFTDSSMNAVTWEWHFGDGTEDSIQNPTHVFQDTGSFVVTLYVTDSTGCRTFFSYPNPIVVSNAPHPEFVVSDSVGCSPMLVNFNQLGTHGDTLIWHFGDNSTYTGNSPQHLYSSPGIYYPFLVASISEGCRDTFYYPNPIIVDAQPVADFSVSDSIGCMPYEIQMINLSSTGPEFNYSWDFGDGITDQTFAPQHLFNQSGLFTISLIVSTLNGCADTMIRADVVEVFDSLPPSANPLLRVSVENNQEVVLEWKQPVETDISHYIIYRYSSISNAFDSIAVVPYNNSGIGSTVPFYLDKAVSPSSQTYSYKVGTVDLCGYNVDTMVLKAHETILLQTVGGFQKVDLSWSQYQGCPLATYEVYRKDILNTSFVKIADLSNTTLSFTDTTAVCPSEYTYKIRATKICGLDNNNSWSNESFSTPNSDIANQVVDVTRATVVDNEFVLVEWSEPVILPYLINRYDVYRSNDKLNYQLIATVPKLMHEYRDMQSAVNFEPYYYKILVQNLCNVNTGYGKPGSSVHLQKLDVSSGSVLKWTSYFDWTTGVEYYVIEKQNSVGIWEEVGRVPGSVTEWEEK